MEGMRYGKDGVTKDPQKKKWGGNELVRMKSDTWKNRANLGKSKV